MEKLQSVSFMKNISHKKSTTRGLEGIHKIRCKYGHDDLKMQNLWNYIQLLQVLSWICKRYRWFDKKQVFFFCKNRFANTFKFANNDIEKLISLLRKCVYLYEYMDDWEKPYFESCFESY